MTFEDNIKQNNFLLPKPVDPVGSYVAIKQVNKLLFVSLIRLNPKPFLGIANRANPKPNLSCLSINSLLFIIIKSD